MGVVNAAALSVPFHLSLPPSNGDTASTTYNKTWLYSLASLSEDDLRAINVLKPSNLFVTNPPYLGDSAVTISFSRVALGDILRSHLAKS